MARYDATSSELLEIAAQGGTPDALYQLGLMYCNGIGVPVDLVEAHKWLSISGQRGNLDARRLRIEISGEMDRSEIAAAQRRAREWLARH
jgi:hypothetical protein